MDWTGLDGWMDPAEKPSPIRAPAVLKILSHWANFYTKGSINLSKTGLILQICMFFQTIYPNLKTFLHGYIRHTRDILQLCPILLIYYLQKDVYLIFLFLSNLFTSST